MNMLKWQERESEIVQSLPSKDFHSKEEWRKISINNSKMQNKVFKDKLALRGCKNIHPKIEQELKNVW